MASPDELWLVDFGDPYPGEPAHHRPALIVGPSRLYGDALPFVVVVPLTTTHRGISFYIEIEPNALNGLSDVCYAQCEMIRSISKKRLRSRLGSLSLIESNAVANVVKRLLDY
jgi:mRNA interferase MazF